MKCFLRFGLVELHDQSVSVEHYLVITAKHLLWYDL